jgi:hypothetical protein
MLLSIVLILFASSQLYTAQESDERPPSRFKVGEEWMALPEVFSKIDFGADATPARADDIEGQIQLRSTRFWGRIYIDGWPQSIQFFRAHFGIEPPMGKKMFVFAEPRDACTELTNLEPITADHVVLVKRGSCTFGQKALNVRKTLARVMVVINNEPGLDHLPGPDAHDVDLAIVSIPQPEGQLLEAIFDAGPPERGLSAGRLLEGYIIPINCEHSGASCAPATFEERDAIKKMVEGGTLAFHQNSSLPVSELPVEYILAHFGVKAPHTNSSFQVALARPPDACSALINGDEVKGKIVLVRRGGCAFVRKAEEVQAAGGAAVVVGSLQEFLVRMGVEPRWKGLNTAVPVLMVSKRAYSILVAESFSGGWLSFREDASVSSAVWEALEKLVDGQGWPRSAAFAAKKYDEFLTEHRSWPDRITTINAAYKKLSSTQEGGQESPATKFNHATSGEL